MEVAAFSPGTWDQFADVRGLGLPFSAPVTIFCPSVPDPKSLPKPKGSSAFLSDSHIVLTLEWGDGETNILKTLQHMYLFFRIHTLCLPPF